MRVLLIGSGGREHAMAWRIAQSEKLTKLFIAPGNPGTSLAGENVALNLADHKCIGNFVVENGIELVVVGPEQPLVDGLHDYFAADTQLNKIPFVGPKKMGAMLEGSKDFAKKFMIKYGIPTAAYQSFTKESLPSAKEFLKTLQPPYVLKADGLAAGKGVVIVNDYNEACHELDEMVGGKFGNAGATVVIEEFLSGIELSVFVLTDGLNYKVLPEAKDYKRIGEGDTGPNTGGMGAVSPVPFANEVFMKKVEDSIIKPTISGLQKEGIDYCGFVFLGLIKVNEEPYVIEYNARMGDPETEVVLPRLKNDLLEMLMAAGKKELNKITIETDPRTAVTVVLVSGGYPDDYEKGKVIKGLDEVSGSIVFHAGTMATNNGIVTAGGRVLAITSYGNSIKEARVKSYENAARISFDNCNFRKDIGFDLI